MSLAQRYREYEAKRLARSGASMPQVAGETPSQRYKTYEQRRMMGEERQVMAAEPDPRIEGIHPAREALTGMVTNAPATLAGAARGVGAGVLHGVAGLQRAMGALYGRTAPEGELPLEKAAAAVAGAETEPGAAGRATRPYRAGVGVGETVGSFATAPVTFPASLASSVIQEANEALGIGPEHPFKEEVFNFIAGMIPPVGAFAERRAVLQDPKLSPEEKAEALEDWWATKAPAMAGATAGAGAGLGAMVRARTKQYKVKREMARQTAQEAMRDRPTAAEAPAATPQAGRDMPAALTPSEAQASKATVGAINDQVRELRGEGAPEVANVREWREIFPGEEPPAGYEIQQGPGGVRFTRPPAEPAAPGEPTGGVTERRATTRGPVPPDAVTIKTADLNTVALDELQKAFREEGLTDYWRVESDLRVRPQDAAKAQRIAQMHRFLTPNVPAEAIDPKVQKAVRAAQGPQRQASAPRPLATGREATLPTPAGDYKARYEVVALEDLVPSHDGIAFNRRPDYPSTLQERPYHRDKAEQGKVVEHAEKFDPRFLVTTNPDASNGPPVLASDSNVVLGGNSRTMTLQRVAKGQARENAMVDYQAELISQAEQFGLNGKQVTQLLKAGKTPILVRRLADVPAADTAAATEAGRRFNLSFTQAVEPVAAAVSRAKNLSPEASQAIGDTLAAAGEDLSLREALGKGDVQKSVLGVLLQEKLIPQTEINRYVVPKTGKLNEAGIDLVEKTLAATIVPDADLLAAAPRDQVGKVVKAVPGIVRARAYGDEWDVSPQIAEAVRWNGVADARGRTLEELWRGDEKRLFGDQEPAPPENVQRMALALRDMKPRAFAAAADGLVRDAALAPSGQGTLGLIERPDPASAIAEAFRITPDKLTAEAAKRYGGGAPEQVIRDMWGERGQLEKDDSFALFGVDPKTRTVTNPTRKKVWDTWLAMHLERGQKPKKGQKPRIIIMSGGWGSGKSTLRRRLSLIEGLVNADADEFKLNAPERKSAPGVSAEVMEPWLHEESAALAKKMIDMAIDRGLPAVYDSSGKGKAIEEFVSKAKKKGYQIEFVHVSTEPHVAFEQSMQRANRTGRRKNIREDLYANHKEVADALFSKIEDPRYDAWTIAKSQTDGEPIVVGFKEAKKKPVWEERDLLRVEEQKRTMDVEAQSGLDRQKHPVAGELPRGADPAARAGAAGAQGRDSRAAGSGGGGGDQPGLAQASPEVAPPEPASLFDDWIHQKAVGSTVGAGLPPPAVIASALGVAGKAVRESETATTLKKHLGTKLERYQALLGASKGREAFDRELLFELERDMGETDIGIKVGKQLTIPDVLNKLKTVPYLGERGATITSRFLRRLPFVGHRYGVTPREMPKLFDAVEAIRELDANNQPVFGTKKYERDPTTGKVTGWQWRYTGQEGQRIWDGLSDQAKKAATWWVTERELLKQTYGVAGNVEGYIHHFWEDGVLDGFRRIMFKRKTAASRKMRMEAVGFVRDFERAVTKGMQDLHHEAVFNDFVKRFSQIITEPVDAAHPLKEGWKEIQPIAPSRGGRFVGQLAGGRQIPHELYDDFVRYVEGGAQASQMAELTRSLGRYFKANLLIHPATAVTNFISGGIQYGTKVVEDFYRGALTGKVRPFLEDLIAPILSLTPSAIENLPPEFFGSRSNVRAELGKVSARQGLPVAIARQLHKMTSLSLWHYGAIENYWKRAIAMSELRAKGLPIDKDSLMMEKKALADMNKAVDEYAFNYQNVPAGLQKFRESTLGAFVLPFPTYGYKLSRMMGRYVAAMNPIVDMAPKERLARIMTMSTILSMVHMASDRDDDKVKEHVDGMPYSLDRTGRVKVANVGGKEAYLRVVKYPWFNFYQGLEAGRKALETGKTDQAEAFLGEFLSEGPLLEGAKIALGVGNRFEFYQPTGVRVAGAVEGMVPFSRLAKDVRGLQATDRRYPRNFKEAIAPSIPLPSSVTGIEPGGKVAIDKATGTKVIPNPTLEQLKFWFGINLKLIDPGLYQTARGKMIMRALSDMDKAKTPDDFQRAQDRLKMLDKSFRQASRRVRPDRIVVESEPGLQEQMLLAKPPEKKKAVN